jgi:hypothetical protein
MLLTLRSLLWRHGAAAAITGTCDTQQAGQTDNCIGVVPVVGGLGGGSLPARRRRGGAMPAPIALPEIIRIPAIAGRVESVQLPPVASARASLQFNGADAQYQARQGTQAFGEMIDVELEMMAALLMEVA